MTRGVEGRLGQLLSVPIVPVNGHRDRVRSMIAVIAVPNSATIRAMRAMRAMKVIHAYTVRSVVKAMRAMRTMRIVRALRAMIRGGSSGVQKWLASPVYLQIRKVDQVLHLPVCASYRRQGGRRGGRGRGGGVEARAALLAKTVPLATTRWRIVERERGGRSRRGIWRRDRRGRVARLIIIAIASYVTSTTSTKAAARLGTYRAGLLQLI